MTDTASARWAITKSFLLSMGIFQALLVLLLIFSQRFLGVLVAALMAPFLPPIFVVTNWGDDWHGDNAIMMAVLCSALAVTLTLSIKYFDNRIFSLSAHVLLVIYWIMSFGILGMAIT